MKRLQVYKNDQWKYVFCFDVENRKVMTTMDRQIALKGDKQSIDYFESKLANNIFRIEVKQ
jgi:hypothetical protein